MHELAFKAVNKLIKLSKKISLAESCTGGMIAENITSIKGASKIFEIGLVVYSEKQKINFLGLDVDFFKYNDVYSKKTALAMVQALKKISRADIAIAITGIADISQNIPQERVGEVFIALLENKEYVKKFKFQGTRNEIRTKATKKVLSMLIDWED